MADTESTPAHEPRTARAGVALLVAGLSLVGGGVAGYSYWRYTEEWLRKPPRLPTCVMASRRALSKLEMISGTEPHDTPAGETVYLRPGEDRAVRCMGGISSELSKHLVAALVEQRPEARAKLFLETLRDRIPRDRKHDQAAFSWYAIASASLKGMERSPESDGLEGEMRTLNACRFDMKRTVCPSRPGIPLLVWIAGAPSAIGLVASTGFGVRALVRRIVSWRRRRAKKPASPGPSENALPPGPLEKGSAP